MHVIMVTQDKQAHGIGSNSRGQTDVPKQVQGKVEDIECGQDFTIMLMTNNSIQGIGNNKVKQIELPWKPYGSKIVGLAAGMQHTLVLTADGNCEV